MYNMYDLIINKFKCFRTTHPNLTYCWITFLELKKRHCGEINTEHCLLVLDKLHKGFPDLTREDCIRILLYMISIV